MGKQKKKQTKKNVKKHRISAVGIAKVITAVLVLALGLSCLLPSDNQYEDADIIIDVPNVTSAPDSETDNEIMAGDPEEIEEETTDEKTVGPEVSPSAAKTPDEEKKPAVMQPYSGSGTSPKYSRESHHYNVSYTFPEGFNLESTLYIKVVINAQLIYVYRRDAKGNPTSCIRTIIMSSGVDRGANATPLGKYMIFDNNANGAGKGRWIDFKTTFGQYGTRLFYITSYQNNKMSGYFTGYMMHSELYRKTDPTSLIVDEYNTIGYPRSHGCMRMQVKDALWIYQNAHTGSIVEIVDGSPNTSLWKQLKPANLVAGTKYDPTDPASGKAGNPGYISFPPQIIKPTASPSPKPTATPLVTPTPAVTATPVITKEPTASPIPTTEPTPEVTLIPD